MTEVISDQDTDWALLFDFESEVCCDVETCDDGAEWKLVMKCCAKNYFTCTPHLQAEKDMLANSSVVPYFCNACHAPADIGKSFPFNYYRI